MPDVRFGVTYQERDDFSDLAEYARRVEELGLDSLWVTENITSKSPALECFTALSFMAAYTSRITIGTSVILLPLRNPVMVAQTTTSLDVLSGGRTVLGVGLGNDRSDFWAYGGNVHERGRRCDEALEVIKRLWTETSVTFDGDYYHLRDYTLLPRPIQKPHPPIWVGGHTDPVLRRAARWADALVPVGITPEHASELYEKVESYASGYGRDPSSLQRTVQIYLCLADTPDAASRTATEVLSPRYGEPTAPEADGPYIFGAPDDCRERIQRFIDVGVEHIVFNMVCYPEEALSQVEVLAREIIPSLR